MVNAKGAGCSPDTAIIREGQEVMRMSLVVIDGAPATVDALEERLTTESGHFTSMQLHNGAVRGLQAHLTRLQKGTAALLGLPLDVEHVRRSLSAAVKGAPERATVRVEIYLTTQYELRVLVRIGEPRVPSSRPLRLHAELFVRPAAAVRDLDAAAERFLRRSAVLRGFDDVLLCAPDGTALETTRASTGFITRGRVIWTQGPAVVGTTRSLLTEALENQGVVVATMPVTLADLASFDAMFAVHSAGVESIAAVDQTAIPHSPREIAFLKDAFECLEWTRL